MTATLSNTFSHLWQYLAKFFLEWEMFWTKVKRQKTDKKKKQKTKTKMSKNMVELNRLQRTLQHIAYEFMLDMHGDTHTRAWTRPQAVAHARTLAHTRTKICNICRFLTVTMNANAPQCYITRTMSFLFYFYVYFNL